MATDPPLLALLPPEGETLPADEILSRFLGYVTDRGLTPYPAQEEAILELLEGKHVILATPTGSGKSLVAEAMHFLSMAEGKDSFYTAPTKALVHEKFFALCEAFGPENVGMMTGDASINSNASIVCCTAEVLAQLALRQADPAVDHVVMDEFHYYGDRDRGMAWQIPLLTLSKSTFLLMSATLGDTANVEEALRSLTGKDVAAVTSAERPVPLDFEYRETPLHRTIEELVEQGRAPIYLVNFTQRACAEQAQNLMSVNFCSKEEKEAIRVAVQDAPFDTPYGKEVSRFVRHGLGVHHAGLLPKYRLLVEKLAQAGQLKVVSGTDTLGVGVNIPIRTVLFTQLCKYDGEKTGLLRVRDFLQISGRAGRKGFDDRGWVVAQAPPHVIENLKLADKEKTGRKVVRHKPPDKGYVHWDRSTFDRLRTGTAEPLEPRFEVAHGMILHLLQSGAPGDEESTLRSPRTAADARRDSGYARLVRIVRRSQGTPVAHQRHLRTAAQLFRTLRQAGIIELVDAPDGRRGKAVRVAVDLQHDFSLNKTLSLWLVDTLEHLDPDSESYALDVVTLVESILENPMALLIRQKDRAKDIAMAEMKAAGVEYEQRIEELGKIDWPKPLAEFVYDAFDAFAEKHPWVGRENVHPKSIAREMFERFAAFDDYVVEYGLQRSEGVLLRYVSDAYKTLLQNVPEAFRNDEIDDFLVQLRAMIRGVDSSLLDEWERLSQAALPGAPALPVQKARLGRPPDEGDDPKAFAIRIRGELHRLLRALAERKWVEAAACIHQREAEWPPERIAAEMEPYFAEHPSVDLRPIARRPHNTLIRETGPRQWEATQKIVDPTGEADWAISCTVDLESPRAPEAPRIELRRIGV